MFGFFRLPSSVFRLPSLCSNQPSFTKYRLGHAVVCISSSCAPHLRHPERCRFGRHVLEKFARPIRLKLGDALTLRTSKNISSWPCKHLSSISLCQTLVSMLDRTLPPPSCLHKHRRPFTNGCPAKDMHVSTVSARLACKIIHGRAHRHMR